MDAWLFEGNELLSFLRREFGVQYVKHIIDSVNNKIEFLIVDKHNTTVGYSFDPIVQPNCEKCINSICCEVSNTNHKQICKFIQKLIYTDRVYEPKKREYYSSPIF
jgi:hypothetical protein